MNALTEATLKRVNDPIFTDLRRPAATRLLIVFSLHCNESAPCFLVKRVVLSDIA